MHNDLALKKLIEMKKFIPFFKGLDANGIMNTIQDAGFIKYAPNEKIFSQDSWSLDIYIVVEGEIIIYNDGAEDYIYLATLEKNSVFGEMCSLTYEPRSSNAQAGEEGATVISFRLKKYNMLYAHDFATLYKNFIKILSDKLRDANETIRMLQGIEEEEVDLDNYDTV